MTAEERAVAEDIRNSSKDEILQRNSDKVQQISDEEVRGPLSQKLGNFRANLNKCKKENLVMFIMRLSKNCDNYRHSKRLHMLLRRRDSVSDLSLMYI